MDHSSPSRPIKIEEDAEMPDTSGSFEGVPMPIRSTASPTGDADNASEDTVGPETVGHGIKEILDALKALENLQVNNSIPLPKVVVVGDQSAGKSSLIEAISEIKVPRNSGTCTRVPLEINLRNSGDDQQPWTCAVKLVFKYQYEPGKSNSIPELRDWVPLEDHKTMDFHEVTSKSDLQAAIQRAQRALLNPSINAENYRPFEASPTLEPSRLLKNQVEFSPNIISLEIVAPDVNNLSFVDLPGIISQTGNRDEMHLTKLIKWITKDYINREKTLVVLTHSLETDRENCIAGALVNEEDCSHRCIGVLTKPDRLVNVPQCQDILDGKAFVLGHEHFITKQPNQNELNQGITHQEALEKEGQFFEDPDKWPAQFAKFKSRSGTKALQKKLADTLTVMTIESLPEIEERIARRLDAIGLELAKLPEPQHEPIGTLNDLHRNLCNAIKEMIDQPHEEFMQMWKGSSREFENQIRKEMKPEMTSRGPLDDGKAKRFHPPPSSNKRDRAGSVLEPIDLSDDEGPYETPTKKQRVSLDVPQTPINRRTENRQTASTPRQKTRELRTRFKIEDVQKEYVEKFADPDIGRAKDSRAFEKMALECVKNWRIPMECLQDCIHQALGNELKAILDQVFHVHHGTEFHRQMKATLIELVDMLLGEQLRENEKILRREQDKPMTRSVMIFRYETEERDDFREKRFQARIQKVFELEDTPDREKRRREDQLKKELGPDPYQKEIDLFAEARSYYRVASDRFIDNITGSVRTELFGKLKSEAFFADLRAVIPSGPDPVANYNASIQLLADDPVRERHRAHLKGEMKRLGDAQKVLDGLTVKYQGPAATAVGVENMDVDVGGE